MKNIYTAIVKFQSDFKGLKPDGNNPFFKSSYITLDGILETVRPLLAKHGLAIIQNAHSDNEGFMCVKSSIIHESGEMLETDIMKMKPQKDDAQQRGSLITYMKRYQLGALLGICESSDDDGNKATFGNSRPSESSITDAQIKRLLAIANSKGYTMPTVKKQANSKYGVTELAALTKEQYDELCNGYEKLEK